MARSNAMLLIAFVLGAMLVVPSHAAEDTASQQFIQQVFNSVVTQITYCASNASTPANCPAIMPFFNALNITSKLREAFLEDNPNSGADAPGPAPAGPYAACYSTLPEGMFMDGLNPAFILPLCNSTRCATSAGQLDTCIEGVISSIGGGPADSPAEAPSPGSSEGEGSNSPELHNNLALFCASPACVNMARALTPPPAPPSGAAIVGLSVAGVVALSSMVLVGIAL